MVEHVSRRGAKYMPFRTLPLQFDESAIVTVGKAFPISPASGTSHVEDGFTLANASWTPTTLPN